MRPPADAVTLAVTVSGGQGGHSGSGIALGRSNAIKVLGRALREAHATAPFRLVSLDGGKSRNAIPRDAAAVISVGLGERGGASRGDRRRRRDDPRRVLQDRRRASRSPCRRAESSEQPWTDEATTRLLDAIALVPTGPLAMSPDFDDLVETSTSLGEAITEGDQLTLHSLSRSSNDSALPEVIAALDAAARLAGGALEVKHNYNGWRPDLDSPALAAAKPSYERLFGEPPIVTAVHAGLETAVIGSKVPRPRHALVRAADRVPAFARRACQHPDRGALLEAARRLRRRDVGAGGR